MTTAARHVFSVPAMSCDHCVAAITEHVTAVDGVREIAIDLPTTTVTVDGGDEAAIVAAIDEAGYDVT